MHVPKRLYLLDRIMFLNLRNWARRSHKNLGYRKIVSLYFKTIGKRRWVFFGKFRDVLPIHLRLFGYVKIKRHSIFVVPLVRLTQIGMNIWLKEGAGKKYFEYYYRVVAIPPFRSLSRMKCGSIREYR